MRNKKLITLFFAKRSIPSWFTGYGTGYTVLINAKMVRDKTKQGGAWVPFILNLFYSAGFQSGILLFKMFALKIAGTKEPFTRGKHQQSLKYFLIDSPIFL